MNKVRSAGIDLKSSLNRSSTAWGDGFERARNITTSQEIVQTALDFVDFGGALAIDVPLSHFCNDKVVEFEIELAEQTWINPRSRSRVSCWTYRPWEYFLRYGSGLEFEVSIRPFSELSLSPRGIAIERLLSSQGFSMAIEGLKQPRQLIETHPGLVLDLLWKEYRSSDPFPQYKGAESYSPFEDVLRSAGAELPPTAFESDDELDAFVAWFIAEEFTAGRSVRIGNPRVGLVVLPNTPLTNSLNAGYLEFTQNWHGC